MTQSIFREKAIEAQNSIDDLPQAMRVVGNWTRPVLLTLLLALCCAVVWSGYVHVPIKVAGNGVIVDRSGELLVPIRTAAGGVLSEIYVTSGQDIKIGQKIARIKLTQRELSLEKSEKALDALEKKTALDKRLRATENATNDRIFNERRASLVARIADLKKQISWKEKKQVEEDKLVEDGVVARNKGQLDRFNLTNLKQQLTNLNIQLRNQDAGQHQALDNRRRIALETASSLDQARADIAAQKKLLDKLSIVTSPVSGAVTELAVDQGSLISAGQPVVSVLRQGMDRNASLEALVFVAMASGKRVAQHDAVYIKPSSLPAGAHDLLKAKVVSVSQTPITIDALKRELGNEELAKVTAAAGPPFAVRVRLEPDKKATSGFAWTSGNGPDLKLTPGTPLSANVVVEHRPLLVLALPALKRMFGAKESLWTADPS